jgi:hypothetical protein
MATTYFIFGLLGGLLTFGLIARFLAALFSERSRQQIKRNPAWHLIWFLIVVLFFGFQIELPKFEHQRLIKDLLVKISQESQASVEQAGGWNELRFETTKLTNERDSETQIAWFFEAKERPQLTNDFPLISKLHPWEIYSQKNATNDGYVFIEVFHGQWGGGRNCTRYYILALTPTNQDELPPSFVAAGDTVRKLTNSVYEVTWQF